MQSFCMEAFRVMLRVTALIGVCQHELNLHRNAKIRRANQDDFLEHGVLRELMGFFNRGVQFLRREAIEVHNVADV